MKIVKVYGNKRLNYSRYLALEKQLRESRKELVLICEHSPVLTRGVQTRPENLLCSEEWLQKHGIEHYAIRRGGDYTAHEPGQIVFYPHVDLEKRKLAISDFFDTNLSILATNLKKVWGIEAISNKDAPGLYLGPADGGAAQPSTGLRKIASIGMGFKRMFTSHGLSVNVSNDLETFRAINTCGDAGLASASVASVGGDPDRLEEFITAWEMDFLSFIDSDSNVKS